MRFSALTLLSFYSLNFLIWASATMRGCPKFFNSGFQVALNLLRSRSLTQLLIVSLAFPTHWASKRVSLTSNIVAEIDDKHTIQRRVSSKLHHLYYRESGTLFNCILQWLARVPCLVVFKLTELVAFDKLTLAWDAEVLATILAQAGYLLVEGVTEVLTIHPVEK